MNDFKDIDKWYFENSPELDVPTHEAGVHAANRRLKEENDNLRDVIDDLGHELFCASLELTHQRKVTSSWRRRAHVQKNKCSCGCDCLNSGCKCR